jgi:hypothetical protein
MLHSLVLVIGHADIPPCHSEMDTELANNALILSSNHHSMIFAPTNQKNEPVDLYRLTTGNRLLWVVRGARRRLNFHPVRPLNRPMRANFHHCRPLSPWDDFSGMWT